MIASERLTANQLAALRVVDRDGKWYAINTNTRNSLRARGLIAMMNNRPVVTAAGRDALERHARGGEGTRSPSRSSRGSGAGSRPSRELPMLDLAEMDAAQDRVERGYQEQIDEERRAALDAVRDDDCDEHGKHGTGGATP